VVDTAPLLEREFAQLAGLGWVGKNTMLLNRQHGSWFFLAALLLDCELDYDQPSRHSYCGTCTACLDACPTQAFPEPYVLDATRCISYLTIELRGAVPREHRTAIGSWLFGCDICQEVCPWNHLAARTAERTRDVGDGTNVAPLPAEGPEQLDRSAADLAGIAAAEDLSALLQLDDEWFRRRFRHTPFWRARRRGLLRNAALVLGNRRSPESHDALALAVQDPEPLVRGAAAWALGQIGSKQAQETLRKQLTNENAPEVRAEIAAAIGK
jgi:epoxyqueuosine reductase